MSLITLFARKERTEDPIDRKLGLTDRQDTVIYRDRNCTKLAARWPWHYSSCPDRRNKYVMLNCWRWRLEWVQS